MSCLRALTKESLDVWDNALVTQDDYHFVFHVVASTLFGGDERCHYPLDAAALESERRYCPSRTCSTLIARQVKKKKNRAEEEDRNTAKTQQKILVGAA